MHSPCLFIFVTVASAQALLLKALLPIIPWAKSAKYSFFMELLIRKLLMLGVIFWLKMCTDHLLSAFLFHVLCFDFCLKSLKVHWLQFLKRTFVIIITIIILIIIHSMLKHYLDKLLHHVFFYHPQPFFSTCLYFFIFFFLFISFSFCQATNSIFLIIFFFCAIWAIIRAQLLPPPCINSGQGDSVLL